MKSHGIRIALTALGAFALALTLVSPASAFIRLTRQGTTGIVQAHWLDSKIPILTVIDPTNNDIPPATALSVIQTAAQSWNDVNTCYGVLNAVGYDPALGHKTPALDGTDGQNSIFFDRTGATVIYPESAARGLSPGAVDFAATTGTVTGTVVSGFNGSAVFGAHVEAFNLADPSPASEISAISGELTVRSGHGDFKIYGLPPGTYAIAIIPLDGVHTIAADPNIGGIFNGIDINFEPEFWN